MLQPFASNPGDSFTIRLSNKMTYSVPLAGGDSRTLYAETDHEASDGTHVAHEGSRAHWVCQHEDAAGAIYW